jgi:hypothetical protein
MNAAACGHSDIISTSETYPCMYEVDWALAHDAIGDRDVAVPRVLGPRWIHARILPRIGTRRNRARPPELRRGVAVTEVAIGGLEPRQSPGFSNYIRCQKLDTFTIPSG